MTTPELITEISRLSLDDKLAILEAVSHQIRQSLRPPAPAGIWRGALKSEQNAPADAELDADYGTYLVSKYG